MGKKLKSFSKRIKIEAEINEITGKILIRKSEYIGWNDSWIPFVDISEGKSIIVVRAELPGVKEEDISIVVYSTKVELRGIKREQNFPYKVKYIRLEREMGFFRRIILQESVLKLSLLRVYLSWKICETSYNFIVIKSEQVLFHSLVPFFSFLSYITVFHVRT